MLIINIGEKMKTRQFTLVELMIVISIIALLLFLNPSDWNVSNNDSRIKQCAMEMEGVLMGMKMFYLSNGYYPGNQGMAKDIDGLVEVAGDFIPEGFDMTEATPVGGRWKFHTVADKAGYLQIFGPDMSDDDMKKLDAIIDDGDPNSGQFQMKGANYDFIIFDKD